MSDKASGCAGIGCLSIIGLLFVGWLLSPNIPPESQSAPSTSGFVDLDARVNFDGTQFHVTNLMDQDWTDVKLEINGGILSGGYALRVGTLKAGQMASAGAMQFAKSDGTRFNPWQMKPQKFVITAKVNGKDGIYAGGWD